ncbi:MAG: hypothetical protein R3F34_15460 [Planctomycetota bacterium]
MLLTATAAPSPDDACELVPLLLRARDGERGAADRAALILRRRLEVLCAASERIARSPTGAFRFAADLLARISGGVSSLPDFRRAATDVVVGAVTATDFRFPPPPEDAGARRTTAGEAPARDLAELLRRHFDAARAGANADAARGADAADPAAPQADVDDRFAWVVPVYSVLAALVIAYLATRT